MYYYTHSKEDLKRVVKMVIEEINKTKTVDNNITPTEDRLTQK